MASQVPFAGLNIGSDYASSQCNTEVKFPVAKEEIISALRNMALCSKEKMFEQKKGLIAADHPPATHVMSINLLLRKAVSQFFRHLGFVFETDQPADVGSEDFLISSLEEALKELPDEEHLRAQFLCDLGCAYHKRGDKAEGTQPSDLDRALEMHQMALRLSYEDADLRSFLLSQRRQMLREKKLASSGIQTQQYLPLILETFQQELALSQDTPESRALLLKGCAECLMGRSLMSFQEGSDPTEPSVAMFDEAIALYREAALLPLEPLTKMSIFRNMGDVFFQKYQLFEEQNLDDLISAMKCYEKELKEFEKQAFQEGALDEQLREKLIMISRMLIHRCSKSPQAAAVCLDPAISSSSLAMSLNRFLSFFDLKKVPLSIHMSHCLMIRNAPGDVTRGIELYRSVLKSNASLLLSNPDLHADILNQLAQAYLKRNQPDDLEAAIETYEKALSLIYDNDQLRAEMHLNLGDTLFRRNFPQQQGQQSDVEQAIRLYQEGLQLPYDDDLLTARFLFSLGEAFGQQNRIDRAIDAFYNVLECPFDHDVLRVKASFRLAMLLNMRNLPAQNGQYSDAECSIIICQNALALPIHDQNLTAHLLGLQGEAYSLRNQTSFLGFPLDLVKAIQAYKDALALAISDVDLRETLTAQLDLTIEQKLQMMKRMDCPTN